MRRPAYIIGFFLIYLGLIGSSSLGHLLVFADQFSANRSSLLSISIANASLIHVNSSLLGSSSSIAYFIFSLLITQLSGILFLTFSLWIYWELFNTDEKRRSIVDALKQTLRISLISECLLFFFFLYAIPIELTNGILSQKVLAATTLAINSFNNAGLTYIDQLLIPEAIAQNFILQIGLIGGITLGSLGIFVIDELFNPKNLRIRLNDPKIDWSLITKVSVFGLAIIMITFSGIYYWTESNDFLENKNIIESAIASIYEISSARGFGYSISESLNSTSTILKLITNIVGAGPFSTGGGLTILLLLYIYSFSIKKHKISMEMGKLKLLFNKLVIYSLIGFATIGLAGWLMEDSFGFMGFTENHIALFSINQLTISDNSSWTTNLMKGITIIVGRAGFIVAGYLTLNQNK